MAPTLNLKDFFRFQNCRNQTWKFFFVSIAVKVKPGIFFSFLWLRQQSWKFFFISTTEETKPEDCVAAAKREEKDSILQQEDGTVPVLIWYMWITDPRLKGADGKSEPATLNIRSLVFPFYFTSNCSKFDSSSLPEIFFPMKTSLLKRASLPHGFPTSNINELRTA